MPRNTHNWRSYRGRGFCAVISPGALRRIYAQFTLSDPTRRNDFRHVQTSDFPWSAVLSRRESSSHRRRDKTVLSTRVLRCELDIIRVNMRRSIVVHIKCRLYSTDVRLNINRINFCGQPHHCYRSYYPTARFRSPSPC